MAAELLKRANELIKNNIHPTTVMAGYRLALKEAVKYIKANLCVPVDKLGRWVGLSASRPPFQTDHIISHPDGAVQFLFEMKECFVV